MTEQSPVNRGQKPPFYKNVLVRHPVLPLFSLRRSERDRLATLDPIVVMGRGHSGTRVVAWMVHYLGIDLGIDEIQTPSGDPLDTSLRHHLRIVAERSMSYGATETPGAWTTNRFQRAIRGHIRRRGHPMTPGTWGWKFPESYLTGPSIVETFPAARFIHLIRDGRDLAFKRHLTDLEEHRLARKILTEANLLEAPHHLQAAASWAVQVERFLDFAASLSPSKVHTIRYEDLVDDPVSQLHAIAAFLGLPVTALATNYATNRVSSKDKSSHKSHDALLVAEVEDLIGHTLSRAGYPPTG